MCRVLNICKFLDLYGRVLNMRRNAIMEGFGIFQDSEFVRFYVCKRSTRF